MRPPSQHSNFFSSLKQLEKRLKSEHPSQQLNNNIEDSATTLSSPIYLNTDQTDTNTKTTDSSEPPTAFLTCSSSSPTQTNQNQSQNTIAEPKDHDFTAVDDIQRLIQLLGLSENSQSLNLEGKVSDFEDEFYERVVGVRGPKCRKEVERLEGWIECYCMNGIGEEREPLRLAHLLLGKAAFVFEGCGDGDDDDECSFGGLEYPETVEDFLKNDPPQGVGRLRG